MKKLGLFLLLAAGLAFAQQDPQQQQPAQQQPAQQQPAAQEPAAQQPMAQEPAAQQPVAQEPSAQQTDVGKPTDTDQALFKGCVGGTKDNYTLTDNKGQIFRLHSDKDINEHVGNMVEIRGTVKKEGDDRPASAGMPKQQELDVADIKTVSKGCAATGMDMDKEKP